VLLDQLSRKSPDAKNASGIDDIPIAVKMIVVTFLDFPDPDKAHRALAINDFFTSFANVYPSRIFPIPKGIDHLLNFCANNLHKPKLASIDADEDRRLKTVVFVWFLFLLEFFRCRT
jgi:hypothetical protein